jgi:hypothetical protein
MATMFPRTDNTNPSSGLERVISASSVGSTTRDLSKRGTSFRMCRLTWVQPASKSLSKHTSCSKVSIIRSGIITDDVALRANDKAGVDDALKLYSGSLKRQSSDPGRPSTSSPGDASTPLHLAVQCAPVSMVEYVVSQRKVDLCARNKQGNTALHLAAQQGREDIVDLILQQADVDDSLANHEGKQVGVSHTVC